VLGYNRVSGFGFRVSGFGFRVSGFGFREGAPGLYSGLGFGFCLGFRERARLVYDWGIDLDGAVSRADELAPEGVALYDLLGRPELRRPSHPLWLLRGVLFMWEGDGGVRD
jgi:hypothetical protein